MKDVESLRNITDAILLEMAVAHPYLTEAEEAALKSRLFAIMEPEDGCRNNAEDLARLFLEAVRPRDR